MLRFPWVQRSCSIRCWITLINAMGLPSVTMMVKPVPVSMKRAQLKMDITPPSHALSRERGGFAMKSDPIHCRIDNRDFYDSLGLKSLDTLTGELINHSEKAVLDAEAQSCREGDLLSSPDSGGVAEIARMRIKTSIETMLVFIPERPSVSWEGGDLRMHYTPDRLHYEWRLKGVEYQYMPYKLKFNDA